MTDLAPTLANSTIEPAAPELREGTVLDDATERGQEVRCIVPSLDANLATDPMPWRPYTTAEGEFWPKKGDRVVLGYQPDGPPAIQWWEPAAGSKATVEGPGVRAIVHGADPSVVRGAWPGIRIWVGSVIPDGMEDNDLLAKYA